MKKAILVGIIGAFSFGVYAQAPEKVEKEKSYEYSQNGDEVSVEEESETTIKTDTSKISVEREYEKSTGDHQTKVGKGADKAGHGAKEAGKGVKEGAEWSYDKAKHNKVTKEVFDQPGDVDNQDTQAKKEIKAKEEDTDVSENLEDAAEETEEEAEDIVE